ncbi:MAG: hypothetical protein QM767_18590 [Anaeromyxobacter sp.]
MKRAVWPAATVTLAGWVVMVGALGCGSSPTVRVAGWLDTTPAAFWTMTT